MYYDATITSFSPKRSSKKEVEKVLSYFSLYPREKVKLEAFNRAQHVFNLYIFFVAGNWNSKNLQPDQPLFGCPDFVEQLLIWKTYVTEFDVLYIRAWPKRFLLRHLIFIHKKAQIDTLTMQKKGRVKKCS